MKDECGPSSLQFSQAYESETGIRVVEGRIDPRGIFNCGSDTPIVELIKPTKENTMNRDERIKETTLVIMCAIVSSKSWTPQHPERTGPQILAAARTLAELYDDMPPTTPDPLPGANA